MKITLVTVNQSTSVNLTIYLSGIAIVIRMKLKNTVGKQITTLAGIRRKLLIGKADQFL